MLFDAQPQEERPSRRKFLKFGGAAFGLVAAGSAAYWDITSAERDLRDSIISYMDQPRFVNPEFTQQVLGANVKFQAADVREGRLYFTAPQTEDKNKIAAAIAKNPAAVRWSTSDGLVALLGDYEMYRRDLNILSLPISDLKIDPDRKASVKFGSIEYDISCKELHNYLSNSVVYGGPNKIDTGIRRWGKEHIFSNICATVTKEHEPSLGRLVTRMTKGLKTQEGRIQALLDLTTIGVKYDLLDNLSDKQTMMRSNEVLLTKKGICNSKVALMASFCEQLDADYRILYIAEKLEDDWHAALAVAGDFPKENSMTITLDGKQYAIAETTARGFFIGLSKLKDNYLAKNHIRWVQKPGYVLDVRDYHTGERMKPA
jgi:hypothetical protein